MTRKFVGAAVLLALLAFFIPIEHKYDKIFRFYSLTLIPPDLSISPAYEPKIYFYPSDIAALFLLFLSIRLFRVPLKEFFGHPIWVIFLCSLLSIVLSPFAHYPIPYVRLLQLLTPLLLFSFLRTSFTDTQREKATQWIFIALISAGLFQSAVGIAQYFHQGPIGLRILSETNAFCSFTMNDGTRWIFDTPGAPAVLIRAQGTLAHANPFGGFLFLSILITYWATLKKWLFGLALPLQIFAMALSFSRSAIFAWILATAFWFSLMLWQKRDVRFIALVTLFSLALTTALIGKQFSNRGGIVNYNEAAQGSDRGRIVLQSMGMEMVRQHPLFGVGYTLYNNRSASFLPPDAPEHIKSTAAHNIFLLLASETGLISLAAFLLTLALLRPAPFTPESITLFSILLGFLFIGCCDFYLLLFQQGKLMLFLIMGLIASHSKRWYAVAS